jgi:hypothetical protein
MEDMLNVDFRWSVHLGAFEKSAVMAGRFWLTHRFDLLFVTNPLSMSQSIVTIVRSSPFLKSEHGCAYPFPLGNAVTMSSAVTTRK